MKLKKTAHIGIDSTTLFIAVIETHGSSFSLQFKFSRKTCMQHSSGEIFENVFHSLSMDESDKNSPHRD
jgi:hypothetical protein